MVYKEQSWQQLLIPSFLFVALLNPLVKNAQFSLDIRFS
jgi:hypothetical protein